MAFIGRSVNTIPSHDVVLRRVVDQVAEAGPRSPAELEAELRAIYPSVAVIEAQLSGEQAHLYVYRDGRYEPEAIDDWWAAPDAASIRIGRGTGRVTSASPSWTAMMRADPTSIIGRRYVDFLPSAARALATAMFDALQGEQEVRSRAVAVRQDGTTLPIEFLATRHNGEIEVFYRPLAPS